MQYREDAASNKDRVTVPVCDLLYHVSLRSMSLLQMTICVHKITIVIIRHSFTLVHLV